MEHLWKEPDAAMGDGIVLHQADGRIDHATSEAHRLLAG
jgi:hypothetical protein